ncbi:MAG: hypothetical protein IPN08_16865 [Bacteroidales bacterium]|nr:hypothetical protein [Bacteroidales bacterium]
MADRFRNLIPEPAGLELSDLVTSAAEKSYQVGLTMVTDAGLDARIIDFYDSLQKEDNLQMSIYVMLNPNEEISIVFKKGNRQKPSLIVRSVKIYADGALGSRGACLLKPYIDSPGDYGIPHLLGRTWKILCYGHTIRVIR